MVYQAVMLVLSPPHPASGNWCEQASGRVDAQVRGSVLFGNIQGRLLVTAATRTAMAVWGRGSCH